MERDGFEDILAGWDLDLPSLPTDRNPAPASAVATAPPQAPVETAVLDRPRPSESTFIEEQRDEPADLPPRGARTAGGFPWGATFALLGAVSVIISAILPWDSGGIALPRDIPAASLLDPAAGGPNLGLVLLGLGTIGALVALLSIAVPATSILRRLIGVLTFAIPLAFVLRALGPEALVRPALLTESLGAGAFVAAIGGFVQALVGGWSFRRR